MRIKIAILIANLICFCNVALAQSSIEINQQFSQISLRGPFKAELIPSDNSSAVVTTYGVDHKRLNWNVKNGRLNISLQVGLLDKDSYATIKIYYPSLDYIGIEGVTIKNSEPIVSTDLTIETLGGINKMQLGVNIANLRIAATGKSDLVIRGSAQDADIKAYLGARIDCMQCTMDDVVATVSQGSEVFVKTSGRLDAKVSTAGNLYYMGNPKLKAKATLGGGIIAIESRQTSNENTQDQPQQTEEE